MKSSSKLASHLGKALKLAAIRLGRLPTTSKRFIYACATCGGKVTKKPVFYDRESGLFSGTHGWECENCGKGAKVTRKLKD